MSIRSVALLFALATPVIAQTPPPPKPADQLPDAPSTTSNAKPPAVPTGPTAVIDTSMGRLTCKLFDAQAPVTVANFIGLADGSKDWTDPATLKKIHNKPLYDGTIFHRVIPGFMIQGGDPEGDGRGDPGYFFQDEFDPGLTFDQPGRLAMANAGPATNGSQFFITESPVPELTGKHTIFGQCDEHSVLLVASIARVERNDSDRPLTPVVIQHITIVRDGQPMPPLPSGPATTTVRQPKPVGGTVTGPVLLYSVEPEFTEAARRKKTGGTIKVHLWIDEHGNPVNVHVTKGLADGLDEKAVEAVQQYKFKPALEDGKPVLAEIDTEVNFQIF